MKRIVLFGAIMIGCSLFYSDAGFSQSGSELNELKREIEALKRAKPQSKKIYKLL